MGLPVVGTGGVLPWQRPSSLSTSTWLPQTWFQFQQWLPGCLFLGIPRARASLAPPLPSLHLNSICVVPSSGSVNVDFLTPASDLHLPHALTAPMAAPLEQLILLCMRMHSSCLAAAATTEGSWMPWWWDAGNARPAGKMGSPVCNKWKKKKNFGPKFHCPGPKWNFGNNT